LKNPLHAGVTNNILNPRTGPREAIRTLFEIKIAPSLYLEAATTIKADPIRKSLMKIIREAKIKINKSSPSKIRKRSIA
jgi:hypothetical protein